MDSYKVQSEILKKACKGNMFKSTYGIWSDKTIALIPDGNYLVLINKDEIFLDINKIWGDKKAFNLDFFKATDKLNPLTKSTLTKEVDKGKVVIYFNTKNGKEVWINEKIMKIFDKDIDVILGSDEASPVYIYEKVGVLSGIVLPVKH